MNDLFSLQGKLAFVSGSNGGLGLVIARFLGQAGAKIILNGRSQDKLKTAVTELDGLGLDVAGYAFDVTRTEEVEENLARIKDEHGAINILVNNAGMHRRAPITELADDDWNAVIDLNLTAAFKLTRNVARNMIANGGGKIINICSLMSEVHRPTTVAYSAAKGGLKMLTRAMAVEFAQHNIQANAIGPGYFHTDLTDALVKDEGFNSWICGRTPANRWGDPGELGGPAVFLASDASSFVNGQIIYVDGGILAGL